MLDRIMRFLRDGTAGPAAGGDVRPVDRLHLAAAALLVEAARMDDTIGPAERQRIGELVRWRFDLDEAEAAALILAAEDLTRGPAEWYGLTVTIRDAFDEAERVQMIEMLWDVVYADGKVHDLEASLMRRVAGLLNVADRDSGAARLRARARHGLGEEESGP